MPVTAARPARLTLVRVATHTRILPRVFWCELSEVGQQATALLYQLDRLSTFPGGVKSHKSQCDIAVRCDVDVGCDVAFIFYDVVRVMLL